MADQLLRTKLSPPPGRVDLVRRPRLFDALKAGLRLPLTLIAAPAGAGKTSLLRSWRGSVAGQAMPLAWVSLDQDDNDPARFWRYTIGALAACFPSLHEDRAAGGGAGPGAQLHSVVTALLNALVDQPEHCLLVFDDYHLIDSPQVHESVALFIERLPPSLRVAITTRVDPPLPLSRWRARGQMAEIRVDGLRFTEEEAAALFRQEIGDTLTSDQVAALTARTEGWAAGLHLASLALHNRPDPERFLHSFTGSHRFVATYLIEEVLATQLEDEQRFLLETSILSHLTGPLCDAVTGRGDSAGALRRLDEANLFVTPLDEAGEWYRYHHLFADVLQHQLRQRSPESVPALHARASGWYEESGILVPAIDHAIKAGDIERAARLVRAAAPAHRRAGEAQLVRRWLTQLPGPVVRSDPELALIGAWSQMVAGPLSDVEGWLAVVDAELAPDPEPDHAALQGEVAAIRGMVASFTGDTARTIAESETALRLLPERDAQLRGVVAMSLGQAHRFDGDLEPARDAYRQAVELGLAADNLYAAIDSLADLGLVLLRLGRMREAAKAFERAERELRARRAEQRPVAGSLAVIWPELLRERNDLAAARDMIQRGIDLGHAGAKMDILITGYRGLAGILWPLGEWDAAFDALRQSRDLAREYGLEHTARGIEARESQMWLACGEIALARGWAERLEPAPDLPGAVREDEALTLARVRLAIGDVDQALVMAAPLRAAAERDRRFGDLIGMLAFESVALDAAGQRGRALAALGRALEIAAPDGYVRSILDEGEPVYSLLRQAVARNIAPDYCRRLLDEARLPGVARAPASSPVAALVEPLSDRERAVLRLLAAGLSAPEIARELYVAPSTIRSHLKNLYRKLDVHSRDQAIARARDIGLIA